MKPCFKCGYNVDSHTCVEDAKLKPHPGDASICLNCGVLGIFDEQLDVRPPTREESLTMEANPIITRAQILRAGIIPPGGIPRKYW